MEKQKKKRVYSRKRRGYNGFAADDGQSLRLRGGGAKARSLWFVLFGPLRSKQRLVFSIITYIAKKI